VIANATAQATVSKPVATTESIHKAVIEAPAFTQTPPEWEVAAAPTD
jgi:hypothetical protein